MKKINAAQPDWADVIDQIGLSNEKILRELWALDIDYTLMALHNLRKGVTKSPAYRVGYALLQLAGEAKAEGSAHRTTYTRAKGVKK